MRIEGIVLNERWPTKGRAGRVFTAWLAALALLAFSATPFSTLAQQQDEQGDAREYPKEIRGYKVERAKVEIKREKSGGREDAGAKERADDVDGAPGAEPETDALIQFGEARVERITPLGITLAIPITVAAVKQKGQVDFLTFEDMIVNDISVTVEDYQHEFDLPTDKPLLLPEPVRVFISTPRALIGAMGEWSNAKQTWPVTGRVYVFGHFKKFVFSFKRVVPVEINVSLRNPLLAKNVRAK